MGIFLRIYLFVGLCMGTLSAYEKEVLDEEIAEFMQEHQIPGLAVGILEGNKESMIFYGVSDIEKKTPVAENTIFQIASITKVFTTTALALNVLAGNVNLNDPISKFIPDLANLHKPINKVTFLELATHTSSLPLLGGNWRQGGFPKIVRFLQHWHPRYRLGSHYQYSNLAFGLLGYALENVEKQSYGEIIHDDILVPLGMRMTFTEVPDEYLSNYATGYTLTGEKAPRRPHGYIPGSGALRSTVKDMLKFLRANMTLKGPENLIKAMKLAQEPFYTVREHFVMGLGWQRFDQKGTLIIDKNGGVAGFTSYIGWIPEKQLGIIILTNKTKARTTGVGRSLLRHLSAQSLESFQ